MTASARKRVERALLAILRDRHPDVTWALQRPAEDATRPSTPPRPVA